MSKGGGGQIGTMSDTLMGITSSAIRYAYYTTNYLNIPFRY